MPRANRIFFLSIPPNVFLDAAGNAADYASSRWGRAAACFEAGGRARVVWVQGAAASCCPSPQTCSATPYPILPRPILQQ